MRPFRTPLVRLRTGLACAAAAVAGSALAWQAPDEAPRFLPPQGAIRLDRHAVADDRGPFPALGATLMWAAWAYRHDRDRLDAHLEFLAAHRFDYIRALGLVGRQPYWAGREIDWRWPDYAEVIAGLTDRAYDRYGLRVQWTLIGDGDEMIPEEADRVRLVDTFAAMARGREHQIMLFELANESWQNGFGGPQGIRQIQALTRRLQARTSIPVAISDSLGHRCADHLALYGGAGADVITEHFHRGIGWPDGYWRPVWQPWTLADCEGLPGVASNNEPIGPGSSVEQDDDPMRLVTAAVITYMANVGLYVFHSDAGVAGRRHLWDMPNVRATAAGYAAMKGYLPDDLANWQRHAHDGAGHPFTVYAAGRAGALWPAGDDTGALRVFASVSGDRFMVVPLGVRQFLQMRARRALAVEVLHPLTGDVLERRDLADGDTVHLEGLTAFVLRGRFR